MRKEKQLNLFLEKLAKLEFIEFAGICKLLHVKLGDEEGNEIPFEELLWNLLEAFDGLNKQQRKEILSLLKDIIKDSRAKTEE